MSWEDWVRPCLLFFIYRAVLRQDWSNIAPVNAGQSGDPWPGFASPTPIDIPTDDRGDVSAVITTRSTAVVAFPAESSERDRVSIQRSCLVGR